MSSEVFALRLGRVERPSRDNFLNGPIPDGTMHLDFTMWVIRAEDRVIAVDCGFNTASGQRRNRFLDRTPVDALAALGIAPADITDVILTHLHYDHAGNLEDFPQARFWVQQSEVAYAASSAMRHHELNHFFDVDDICTVMRQNFQGNLQQLDGHATLVDGVELHHIGGHTPGLQVVRVATERGWVVLASDALHYYDNLIHRNPFPAIVDVPAMIDGFDTVRRLASSEEHIIPGHDPLVFEKYAEVSADLPDGIVRLHCSPQH